MTLIITRYKVAESQTSREQKRNKMAEKPLPQDGVLCRRPRVERKGQR